MIIKLQYSSFIMSNLKRLMENIFQFFKFKCRKEWPKTGWHLIDITPGKGKENWLNWWHTIFCQTIISWGKGKIKFQRNVKRAFATDYNSCHVIDKRVAIWLTINSNSRTSLTKWLLQEWIYNYLIDALQYIICNMNQTTLRLKRSCLISNWQLFKDEPCSEFLKCDWPTRLVRIV